MRQQLRLRVLAPLGVLALLGAGFGAYAFGQAPAPAQSSLTLPTGSGATDTTAAADTTATEPEAEPGAVAPAVWVQEADALCLDSYGETIARPRTPAEVDALLYSGTESARTFAVDFRLLGWPEGMKATALELQGYAEEHAGLLAEASEAFRRHKFQKLFSLAEQEAKLIESWNDGARELGAGKCIVTLTDSDDADSEAVVNYPLTGAEALRWVLYVNRVAVVVFYTPGSGPDSSSVFAARVAALDTGAGFLAVDVTRERQVAAIAIGYEVLRAPTVLVLSRGPTLEARFDEYVDRVSVAQAVENALR